MSMLSKSLGWRSLPLLALAAMASATNLQLSQVQPIIGFSSSCTAAYNTRLPSCSFDDLLSSVGGRNGGCSVSCISELNDLQSTVQASCQGERAGRETVIGQMFLGTVVDFLCGNVVGGTATAGTTSSASSMTAATTSMSTAEPVDTTTTSDTTTSEESTSTTDTTTAATTSAAQTSSASTASESSSSSTAQATASSAANQGGQEGSGGGSPFDGGPGEFDGAAPRQTLRDNPTIFLTLLAILLLVR